MPSIKSVFENSPVPASAHLVSGHVKKGNTAFDAKKSYFTDSAGSEIASLDAIKLLIKAKDTATALGALKGQENKGITSGVKSIHAITADTGKLGYAVNWGDQVGIDNAAACKWICLFVTSTLTSARHQWVTAFPATDTYVNGKKM